MRVPKCPGRDRRLGSHATKTEALRWRAHPPRTPICRHNCARADDSELHQALGRGGDGIFPRAWRPAQDAARFFARGVANLPQQREELLHGAHTRLTLERTHRRPHDVPGLEELKNDVTADEPRTTRHENGTH